MVKKNDPITHTSLTTLYTRTHTHTTRKKNHTDLGSTHRLVQMFLDDRWRGMGKTIYICCSVMYFTVHALHRKERRNERKKDGRTVEHEDSEYNNLYYRKLVLCLFLLRKCLWPPSYQDNFEARQSSYYGILGAKEHHKKETHKKKRDFKFWG